MVKISQTGIWEILWNEADSLCSSKDFTENPFFIYKTKSKFILLILRSKVSQKRIIIAVFIVIVFIVGFCTAYNLGLKKDAQLRKTYKGAVVSNVDECAEVGASMLKKGGSAADAAIATYLCEEIPASHAIGIGGGFHMVIYNKEKNLVECLHARETAPLAATQDMFVGKANASREGGLSIAVPAVIKGFWELHQKYGKLPWKDLFLPTIELARKGVAISNYFGESLQARKELIMKSPSLREILIDPKTNSVWVEGDIMKRPVLATTLEVIAEEGADTIYKMGKIGRQLLDDIKEHGGIITEKDFLEYKPQWRQPVQTTLKDGEKVYSVPSTGSGALLVFILNILKGYEMKHDVLSYHRIIEAFKFAFAKRAELADTDFVPSAGVLQAKLVNPEFANEIRKKIDDLRTHHEPGFYGEHFGSPEDHGTCQISVLAPNGDAIAVTGSLNFYWGSLVRSKTGIILNNVMDDFSTPGVTNIYGVEPSPANFIAPGKRPMSSMAPTIIVKPDGNVGMIVGSAGGPAIITSIAKIIVEKFFMETEGSIADIVKLQRLHHQLQPDRVQYDENFDQKVIDGLTSLNHTMEKVYKTATGAATAILTENGSITGAFDPRRGGSVAFI